MQIFDFKHYAVTHRIEKTYLSLYQGLARDYLLSAVVTENAGLGKTHLARSLVYGARQQELSVLFLTAAEMVNHLVHVQKTFSLEQGLSKYREPQVLIIDEQCYAQLRCKGKQSIFSGDFKPPLSRVGVHCYHQSPVRKIQPDLRQRTPSLTGSQEVPRCSLWRRILIFRKSEERKS